MTRAFLLSALLAPALAAAQAVAPIPQPGQITFPDVAQSAEDGFINAAECTSPTAIINLSWLVTGNLSGITGYELFAANQAHPDDKCFSLDQEDGKTSLRAGSVRAITEDIGSPMMNVEFSTSAIVARAGFGTCDAPTDQPIHLCIQARGGGEGRARGRLTLSLVAPAAPRNVSVQPGEEALNVSWDRVEESATTRPATDYLVEALGLGPTDFASHTSGRIVRAGDRPDARIEGLVNGDTYEVRVFAFSEADNQSDPSLVVTASPVPVNDFFETYKAAGGVEEGGCASGTAGPVAIGAVALLLAALARRGKA